MRSQSRDKEQLQQTPRLQVCETPSKGLDKAHLDLDPRKPGDSERVVGGLVLVLRPEPRILQHWGGVPLLNYTVFLSLLEMAQKLEGGDDVGV